MIVHSTLPAFWQLQGRSDTVLFTIFHIIYSEKAIWKLIISQLRIFCLEIAVEKLFRILLKIACE